MPGKNQIKKLRRDFLVYIIESPSLQDFNNKISEGEILSKALSLSGISSYHKIIKNEEMFYESLLSGLTDCLQEVGVTVPVFHISAHGNKNGIQLTNGKEIHWSRLKKFFIPINKVLNNTLMLCMSSCEGFSAFKMAMTGGDIPFVAMIGNSGKPSWSDTAIAFATFYHLISKGYYTQNAVDAMKVASGDNNFSLINGENIRSSFLEAIKKIKIEALLEELKRINISKY